MKVKNINDFYFYKIRYLRHQWSDDSGFKSNVETDGYYVIYQKYYKGVRILENNISVFVNKCGGIGELVIQDNDIVEEGSVDIIKYEEAKMFLMSDGIKTDDIIDSEFLYLHPGKKSGAKELIPVIAMKIKEKQIYDEGVNDRHEYKVKFINLLKEINSGLIITKDRDGKYTNLGRIF